MGSDRSFVDSDEFISFMAASGSESAWKQWFGSLDFTGAIVRTWIPAAAAATTRATEEARPGGRSSDNDKIYAIAVCFATTEGAHTYATHGATDPVSNGTRDSLPLTDGRLTIVNGTDRSVATALVRAGTAVITFTVWSGGPAPADLLRQLATEQATRSARS